MRPLLNSRAMLPIVTSAAVLLANLTPAHAAKTYTPEQLVQLVNAGRFPAQSGVKERKGRSIDFEKCKVVVRNTGERLAKMYPVRVVADNGLIYSIKHWTYNEVTVITCSKLDGNEVHVISGYK